jgi:hypothetical protein
VRGPAGIAVVAGVSAYAWWATAVAPFTAGAYLAVALPVAGLAIAALVLPGPPRLRRPAERPWYGALPWVGLLAVAVALESAGLVLGGRSTGVPTLSTVVDHALAWHAVRFVLFLAWLALGWAPVARQAVSWRQPGA